MVVVRLIKNKSGAEAFAVGITPQDLFMLRKHHMCQLDVRTYATGVAAIMLVLGESEEQILNIIDPHQQQVVVGENRLVMQPNPVSREGLANGTALSVPAPGKVTDPLAEIPPIKDTKK